MTKETRLRYEEVKDLYRNEDGDMVIWETRNQRRVTCFPNYTF